MTDPINPPHYKNASGVECIDVAEHFSFCRGNAIKYLFRAGQKSDDELQDLKKCRWYLNREIARLEKKLAPEVCAPIDPTEELVQAAIAWADKPTDDGDEDEVWSLLEAVDAAKAARNIK